MWWGHALFLPQSLNPRSDSAQGEFSFRCAVFDSSNACSIVSQHTLSFRTNNMGGYHPSLRLRRCRTPKRCRPIMTTVIIGTASWTDKSLIDSGWYYPYSCASAEARLRFYSSEFPLVEVDTSYYGMGRTPSTTWGLRHRV